MRVCARFDERIGVNNVRQLCDSKLKGGIIY